MKSQTQKSPWNLINIALGTAFVVLAIPALGATGSKMPIPAIPAADPIGPSPAATTTFELKMAGGSGCHAKGTQGVKITAINADEALIDIPDLTVHAGSPATQSRTCRMSFLVKNGSNRQFAITAAEFKVKAQLDAGINARIVLETYAQSADPDTKTDLVFVGPRSIDEQVKTDHEPKWSLCSGNRLFNAGFSVRMGKVGGGPATGESMLQVSGPLKFRLKWKDCAATASR